LTGGVELRGAYEHVVEARSHAATRDVGEDGKKLVDAQIPLGVHQPHQDDVNDVAVGGRIPMLGTDPVDPGPDLLRGDPTQVEEHALGRLPVVGGGEGRERGSGHDGEDDGDGEQSSSKT
jgi:hypothetical protein